MYFFYHIPPHIEEGRYDQEDTDKMDFIENLVHEPLYVLSHLKLVSGHSISLDLILLWSSYYLIPISFPILRFYAKGRLPLFIYLNDPCSTSLD